MYWVKGSAINRPLKMWWSIYRPNIKFQSFSAPMPVDCELQKMLSGSFLTSLRWDRLGRVSLSGVFPFLSAVKL